MPRMAFCSAWPTLVVTTRTSLQWQSFGNLKAVVLRELGIFLVTARFRQGRRVFLVIDIRDSLEEEQREDVGLEVGGIHRAAQDVRGLPEVGFKLAKGSGVIGLAWFTPVISLCL